MKKKNRVFEELSDNDNELVDYEKLQERPK